MASPADMELASSTGSQLGLEMVVRQPSCPWLDMMLTMFELGLGSSCADNLLVEYSGAARSSMSMFNA